MRFIIPPTYLRLLLLCFLYVSTQNLYAQEQEIDSLAKYSNEELIQKYDHFLYVDIHKAGTYANRVFENAVKSKDQEELHQAYKRKAILESKFGNYEKAIESIDKAKIIAIEELKDSFLEISCVYLKGKISYEFSKYDEAFEHYTTAQEFYSVNNKFMANITSHAIALIKNELGDQKGAIKILKKNYKAYKEEAANGKKLKNFSSSFQINTLLAICDTYIRFAIDNDDIIEKKTYLDSALTYNQIGFKEASKKGNKNIISLFIAEKGIINTELGNYEEAIELINTSTDVIIKEGIKGWLPSLFYYKGLTYHKLANDEKAIHFLKKVDSVSQKNAANYPILQRTYYLLSKIYKGRNDIENKSKYLDLYMENDQINERITGTVRSDIHEKYDIKKLNEELKELNYTNDENEANYNTALIIIFILAFLFIIYWFYNKNRQQQNKAKFDQLLKELAKKKEASHATVKKEKEKSTLTIDEEKVQQILTALAKFEDKKQFLDVNCDLAFVAKKVKTNKAYLSKVIHSEKQQKFIQYITNLRINYALEKLKEDKLFRSYDIKSIALELGFKSPDSFSRAFKNKTGIYPSYYIKNINKINISEDI
ncbi:helix-turn-helix transcriptional regulator [uncultured Kordia sp.]|uniref:helix-turn-helix domain-containing protein n=1 Tax=uncultured Kordia sp. TaxID=507699 RepID=UPI00260CA66C|nr:helix-turn-helix transcriptional regulator [uncultured Kordia sp.]